jgi:tetratricopeptide (TPR) repeat protein
MRGVLADPSLSRSAGRFVWLELDFDKPQNQDFIAGHDVSYTPSSFLLDPATERATASTVGGMTLQELNDFLDRGEKGLEKREKSPADLAAAQGDECVAGGRFADAAAAYRKSLVLAAADSPQRSRVVRALAWALVLAGDSRSCAETVLAEAPRMPRDAAFGSTVLAGLMASVSDDAIDWTVAARKSLEPLATEAIALPATLRDDRFQLYQHLMMVAQMRSDTTANQRWGERWLKEIDATSPTSDDERSALDIARVDAVSLLDAPERAIPALAASERSMPKNYNASLRLAELLVAAKHYDDAIAACDRGLPNVTGPIARSWILQTKSEALLAKGRLAEARSALEDALAAAKTIGNADTRARNVDKVTREIEEVDKRMK